MSQSTFSAKAARELAPYQGFPRRDPSPIGVDPLAPMPMGADAIPPEQFPEPYRKIDDPESFTLSETTPETGGALIPPEWAGRRFAR